MAWQPTTMNLSIFRENFSVLITLLVAFRR